MPNHSALVRRAATIAALSALYLTTSSYVAAQVPRSGDEAASPTPVAQSPAPSASPDAPPAPAGQNAIPEVVITSTPTKVYEAPTSQTMTTIGRDEFKDTPGFSIGETLVYSPGVTIKQGNGPRDVGISIRGSNDRNGFGVRNLQVFEDGFPVTQPDGLSRTDLTDPHAYGSIDVYRGPSSVLFGNYATGGAINFRTRPGGDIDGFEGGVDIGSFNYRNGYGLFGKKGEGYEFSLFGGGVRSDGFIANSDFATHTENALTSYSPTLNDTFTFKIINNRLDTHLPIRLSLNQFNQNPFQRNCVTAATAAAGCATVNLFNNGISGATTARTAEEAGLGRNDTRSIGGARWEHNFDNATTWRTMLVYDNKDISQPTGATSAIGDQPSYNVITDVTNRGQVFGLDATHFFGLYQNYVWLDSSTYNVASGGNATLGALSSRVLGLQANQGAHVREEIKFAPAWTAVGGLAIERTRIEATSTNYITNVGATVASREFVNWAYEAGLKYRPDKDWTLHGRAASGYGTPQASNLFVTSSGVAGNNTQLKTQKNYGFDLGADWSPVNTALIGVTGFYEFFRDELVSQSPGAGLSSFTFNAPRSEHRGVEVYGDWRPAPGWRFRLSYTYDDQIYTQYVERLSAGTQSSTFDRAGNKIPGIQPHYMFARLGYDVPDGPLAGFGGFIEDNFRGGFNVDNANLVQVSDYNIVNLNLHYTPQLTGGTVKSFSLFFEIQNLFDKTYIASANNIADSISSTTGAQNGAATVANTGGSIYAGAPQTFIAGMKMKF
jgi:iron complex outermembrane recepter protein